jgi:hypothetical protein
MQQLSDSPLHSGEQVERRSFSRIRPMLLAAALCALFMLPVAWNTRQMISNDGLSYLELAENSLRLGPIFLLSNAYWSPFYPALLALGMKVAHPARASELIMVRSIDWVICAFACLCFTYLLWNLTRWVELKHPRVLENRASFHAIVIFSYSLLFVSNLDISLWLAGPNILVEAAVYLAAALCVRVSLPDARLVHYVWLGVVFALSYAVKVVLLPLSFVLLAILFVRPGTRNRVRLTIAAGVLAVGASPLIAILSHAKGHMTYGDAGTLTYAWYVNNSPRSILWEGQLPGSAVLRHPARKVWESPPILKFDGPGQAITTYSYWYDPSWWYDGVKSHFNLHQQMQQFLRALGRAPKIMLSGRSVLQLAEMWLPIWAGMAALIIAGLQWRAAGSVLREFVWIFLWSAAAGILFAAVLLDYRYVFPFVVLAWTALFVAAWIGSSAEKFTAVALTVAAGLLLAYGPDMARGILENVLHPPESDRVLAKRLNSLGIRPGDELVSVDFASFAYYARLAGARVSMQMLTEDLAVPPKLSQEEIRKLPQPEVQALEEALRANGARALVSMWRPPFDNDSGWVPVTKSIFVRLIP